MGPGASSLYQIVAVVEDGKYETLTELPKPAVFFPILQQYSPTIVLMTRSHRPESELAVEMREAVGRLDPHLAIYGAGSLHQMLGLVYLPMHAAVAALGAFGVLALMLSITGIYGLAAYTVSRRVREIGIRVAIGARPAQVLRLVFARTVMLVAAGAVAGLALGHGRRRVCLASIVYQASSRDPVVIVAAVLSIGGVASGGGLRTRPAGSAHRSGAGAPPRVEYRGPPGHRRHFALSMFPVVILTPCVQCAFLHYRSR